MKLHPNLGAAGTHLVPVSLTTVISPNGIVKTDSSEQLDQQSVIKSDYLVVIVGRWQQQQWSGSFKIHRHRLADCGFGQPWI